MVWRLHLAVQRAVLLHHQVVVPKGGMPLPKGGMPLPKVGMPLPKRHPKVVPRRLPKVAPKPGLPLPVELAVKLRVELPMVAPKVERRVVLPVPRVVELVLLWVVCFQKLAVAQRVPRLVPRVE